MNPLAVMTADEFIVEMNKAIREDDNYENGMCVKNIGSGYVLEQNGVELQTPDVSAMLSKAHKSVADLALDRLKNQSRP